MPLPLAPIAGFALRAGAVAAAGWAVRRVAVALRPGRTDQRAEDALDDMDEGLAVHRPADRGQTNAAARMVRRVTLRGQTYEVDASALARFRIRKL